MLPSCWMSSTIWMPEGAPRRNLRSSLCSAGRNLPDNVSVEPLPLMETRKCFSAATCSMRPLYSAAADERELTGVGAGEGAESFVKRAGEVVAATVGAALASGETDAGSADFSGSAFLTATGP